MMTRRTFLKGLLGAGAALALPLPYVPAAPVAAVAPVVTAAAAPLAITLTVNFVQTGTFYGALFGKAVT